MIPWYFFIIFTVVVANNSWLNAEIHLFAIKNPIKKIFRNIWTQKKKKKRKKL
jgi:hypothetical protein